MPVPVPFRTSAMSSGSPRGGGAKRHQQQQQQNHRHRQKQNRRQVRKARTLDMIPAKDKKDRTKHLRAVFRRHVCLALALHTTLATLTALYLFVWWDTGYTLVLFARALVLVRILLLLRVLSLRIDVLSIYGVGRYYKIVRHFRRYPPLGAWLGVGFVDLSLVRWKLPLFDTVHFVFVGPVNSLQFPAYLALDLLYLADFYVTLHWVYYAGVRRNVVRNLVNATRIAPV